MKSLPRRCRILPHEQPFYVPGFRSMQTAEDAVLAPIPIECAEWYCRFEERVVAAIGKSFLPVCRLSDGEFRLLFDLPAPVWELEPLRWLGWRIRNSMAKRVQREFRPATNDACQRLIYSSGRYEDFELLTARECYRKWVPWIAEQGVLGLHLSYGKRPFQERYFPYLGGWLADAAITLTINNYVPFYFVYGLLRGPNRSRILSGHRVLVVHGAADEARDKIVAGLKRENVANVTWLRISLERSLFDRLDVSALVGHVDLCLIGAGVGKPNIMSQLAPLHCPCIDAGFAFEVWKNPEMRRQRAFMICDAERAESMAIVR